MRKLRRQGLVLLMLSCGVDVRIVRLWVLFFFLALPFLFSYPTPSSPGFGSPLNLLLFLFLTRTYSLIFDSDPLLSTSTVLESLEQG